MNFQQLRIIREAARQDYNLTDVANVLFTSQSGVSKHIKDLEDELGVELFIRKGKRLLGLTAPGSELLTIVERMLLDAGNIKKLAEQFSQKDEGQLVVVTTHTQARYALPRVVTRFKSLFPKVHLVLHQASPSELVTMLNRGEADIGIATEAISGEPDLVSFPFYDWHHSVIAPPDHPLHQLASVDLAALAGYPIVTYHHGFTGRAQIDEAFASAGLIPDVVMTALDADVIKTYVELGLGVGIVASIALHPERDSHVPAVSTPVLFGTQTTRIAVRRNHYLRSYAYRFIELCSPRAPEALVRSAVQGES
ncbi:CysB family HTH-type transcriptional regulator [Chitinibacteraceae bacterium HSL-7]